MAKPMFRLKLQNLSWFTPVLLEACAQVAENVCGYWLRGGPCEADILEYVL